MSICTESLPTDFRAGWTLLCISLSAALGYAAEPRPSGDSVIRGQAGPSEIVITTTRRCAGAIHSLVWNGKEFIDSFDHGRQLQSASNFDVDGQFIPETFNPTEAGSLQDGRGEHSTSRLLHLLARDNQLQTTTQMAFWLRPGEKSLGHPAKNNKPLSDHLLTKRVTIGAGGRQHVIAYDVTFHLPVGETNRLAQFEVVTGYMPPEFGKFWKLTPQGRRNLDDGPGEQPDPVIFSTDDERFAMGIYARPHDGMTGPGFGRFRFESERVNKWNCVFRATKGCPPGDYRFQTFVAVGTLADVERELTQLSQAGETSADE